MVVKARLDLGAVIPLIARAKVGPPWSNEELAQLFGVAQVLSKAGLAIDTENGVTDEGDPWFAFVRPDSDEVVAHFARIDGLVVGTGLSIAGPVKGARLRDVVSQLLDRSRGQSFALRDETRSVILHPIVGLATFIAIGMLAIDDANGASEKGAPAGDGVLRAALDFVIDHLRSNGPSDEDEGPLGELRGAPGDLRAGLAASELQTGSKQLQVLATVVAVALSLSGAQPVIEEASADILLTNPPQHAGIAHESARSATMIVADDAAGRGAEYLEFAHAANHEHVAGPLDALIDDFQFAAVPAPEAGTQEALPVAGPQFVFVRPADSDIKRDAGVDPALVRFETNLVQIDMTDVTEDRPATASQMLAPLVRAMVLLTGERLIGEGKILLDDLLETSAPSALRGGHSYILLDFAANIGATTLNEVKPHQATTSVSLSSSPEESDSLRSASPLEGDSMEATRPHSAEAASSSAASNISVVLDTSQVIDVPSATTRTVALSAAAETVLFNGGNVRVEHFQLGVDKLLVASPLLDWSKAAITFNGADAVIQFDSTSSLTLIGVLSPHELAV